MRLRNFFPVAFLLLFAVVPVYAQSDEGMVDVHALKKVVDNLPKNVIILDVRTENEFEEGNIKYAQNVNFLSPSFEDIMSKKDKSKTYYVYCFSGGRSAQATSKLREMGFNRVYDVDKGIREWTKAGYRLNKE